MKLAASAAVMATVLVGCGSDSEEPQDRGNLSTIQREIFTPKCALSGCHGAPLAQPPGLDLSEGNARAALVNVDSTRVAGGTRVVPGEPSASVLFEAVSAHPPPGVRRMPLNAQPLARADLDAISQWIAAGAPDN
jgi:hypothetical protein